MMKWLDSAWAFILYTGVMMASYIMPHFMKDLSPLAFQTQFSLGFIAYLTKRYTRDKLAVESGNNIDQSGN